MFYNNTNFKLLEAGVQLTTMQQQLHLQNIANIETPGYKTKKLDVNFDEVLKMAQATNSAPISSITASVVTEDARSLLQDGNNVDIEKESLGLYKTYAQYSALLDKIQGQFEKYSYVLNSNIK